MFLPGLAAARQRGRQRRLKLDVGNPYLSEPRGIVRASSEANLLAVGYRVTYRSVQLRDVMSGGDAVTAFAVALPLPSGFPATFAGVRDALTDPEAFPERFCVALHGLAELRRRKRRFAGELEAVLLAAQEERLAQGRALYLLEIVDSALA